MPRLLLIFLALVVAACGMPFQLVPTPTPSPTTTPTRMTEVEAVRTAMLPRVPFMPSDAIFALVTVHAMPTPNYSTAVVERFFVLNTAIAPTYFTAQQWESGLRTVEPVLTAQARATPRP